jgi:hypothetical protein
MMGWDECMTWNGYVSHDDFMEEAGIFEEVLFIPKYLPGAPICITHRRLGGINKNEPVG